MVWPEKFERKSNLEAGIYKTVFFSDQNIEQMNTGNKEERGVI